MPQNDEFRDPEQNGSERDNSRGEHSLFTRLALHYQILRKLSQQRDDMYRNRNVRSNLQ